MTTHYEHGGQAACVARIKAPWLTEDARIADCKNCVKTEAYQRSVPAVLPPLNALYEGPAHPADVPMLLAWLERAG